MGSRKLLIFIVLLMVATTICCSNDRVIISCCKLTENSLVIDITLANVIVYDILGVRIAYKDIPKSILFEPQEISYTKMDSKITITLNLSNKILYTNEEAELYIKISGGFFVGNLFIGNPIINIEPYYSFPSNAYEKVKIIILDQRYVYRM